MASRVSSVENKLAACSRVFEDLTDPIIVEDMSGTILDINPEAERLYGWSRQELINQPTKILVPPDSHSQVDGLVTRCRQGELVRNVETVRRDKLGRDHPILLTLSLLTTECGDPLGIVSIEQDITELKRTSGRLRRAERTAKSNAAEMKRNNEKLQEFVRVCSHDLHAPLRGIAGFCELLQNDCAKQFNDTANQYFQLIIDSVSRMQQLLDDLLEYAQSDSQELTPELMSCEDIVEDALANLEADITETKAVITLGPMPTVMADGMQLMQVFQNLVSNAIKYSGDFPPVIHISATRRDKEWLFSVRDHGIGIARDKLAEIFRPFERLHSSEEYEGTGIGLATCQRVIERHGGRIWAESVVGNGCEFLFTLPSHDE